MSQNDRTSQFVDILARRRLDAAWVELTDTRDNQSPPYSHMSSIIYKNSLKLQNSRSNAMSVYSIYKFELTPHILPRFCFQIILLSFSFLQWILDFTVKFKLLTRKSTPSITQKSKNLLKIESIILFLDKFHNQLKVLKISMKFLFRCLFTINSINFTDWNLRVW